MKRLIPLAAAALLGGCVSPGKYKALQSQSDYHRSRSEALDAQVAGLKKDLETARKSEGELKVSLQAVGDQLASAQKSNADLQESLEAKKGELAKKVQDLIKERDALEAKLGQKTAEIGGLNLKLGEAQALLKALEEAKAAELAALKKSNEELTTGLKAEIAAGEVKITELKGKLTVNLVDRVLFDSGEAEVKPQGRKVLEKVGGLLNSVMGKDIRIEGHTDNVPITGPLKERFPTNWELSTARATAVARYLQDKANVVPSRLVAAGYGEFRPVAANDTPDNRALNRRIEIILVPSGE